MEFRKQGNNDDTSSKAMLAIDGVGFDWSDMAEEQVQTNMALMAFSDPEQEKEGIEFKIEKFDMASKDLDKLLGSQITDKSKKGLVFSVVPPPHSLIYNTPNKLDLSYSGLDEFKEPKFKGYGIENSKKESNIVCEKKSNNSKENSDNYLVKEQVSKDTSSFVESSLNVDKETVFLVDKKVESVKPKNHEKPIKKSVRYVKRGQDTKIPQSSGLPIKVGDEVVHKELVNRMERAATTASSLEAEQDSGSGPRYQDTILGDVDTQTRVETTSEQSNDTPLSRGYTLGSREDINAARLNLVLPVHVNAAEEKPAESDGFHEILDFLNANQIRYALTVNPTIYISCIQQFWATAKANTINGERHLQALIDKKKVIITETSIRSDLHLEDTGVFINQQLGDMSHHKKIYVNPSHTKKIFANMRREGKDFSERVTPLFETMMVQPTQDKGVDSGIPTDSNQIPITTQPSTSISQKKQSRRKQRKDTTKAKDAQAKEIADLKKRVQKLERKNKSRTTGLKRLRKVGMSRRVESSEEKDSLGNHEDASKQGGSIEDIDKDADVSLVDDT
ncbi:hypothetical protein Tco_0154198 [Tanacetum coccineum]